MRVDLKARPHKVSTSLFCTILFVSVFNILWLFVYDRDKNG